MQKNVLILSSSPRKKGNSDLLCDEFCRGAQEAGNRAEKIFLRDRQINYCLACDGCQRNGGDCVQKDDMAMVLAKMIAADVIVLATPVYFYTMSAQLKTLIDRTYPQYTQIRNKEIYVIVTAAEDRMEAAQGTVDGIRGFISCLPGARERGIIYGIGAEKRGEIRGMPVMHTAYEMGKSV